MRKLELDDKFILEKYKEFKSAKPIAKLLNCSEGTIRSRLRKHINIFNKSKSYCNKYNYNRNYFENIDTPQKAYILGFISADGCNSKTRLKVNIQERDIEIIEFIRNEIGVDLPIGRRIGYNNIQNQSLISIYSTKICNDLNNLGVTPRKSKTLKFPNIENKLMSDYLRGYFDGDGCIKKDKKGNGFSFSYISASEDFILKLEEILRNNCNLNYRKIYTYSKTGVKYLEYTKKQELKNIFNYLYNNSCFHLSRKYEKFLSVNG